MKTSPIRIEFGTYATSYGLGPFHPAIRTPGVGNQYWPNITFATEDETYDFAAKALKSAYDAAAAIAAEWNVWPVEG